MKTSELVFTAEETRMRGLELVGFDKRRQNKCNLALNNRRFRAHFGSHPMVYAELWYDLQSTNVEDAKICGSNFCRMGVVLWLVAKRRYRSND